MSLEESRGSDGLFAGTFESFNLLQVAFIICLGAFAGFFVEALGTVADANGDIKDEWEVAFPLEDDSVIALVVPVANAGVLVLEIAVGTLASRINVFLDGLHVLALSAFDVVGQHALLSVDDRIVKEVAVRTEDSLGHLVFALVVQVALLWIRKQTILFRASEIELGSREGRLCIKLLIVVIVVALELWCGGGDHSQAQKPRCQD